MGQCWAAPKKIPGETSITTDTTKRELSTDMNGVSQSTFHSENQERTDTDLKSDHSQHKVNIDSFERVRMVGQGSYAKVFLAKKLDTEEHYAMKVLKKAKICDSRAKARVLTERNIMKTIDHPFIVKLHYSFQTEDKLYFLLDFLNGGDLFHHIAISGKFKEKRARFYAAELVLALNFLHENNIVYRDLKPQNIIIGKDGHVKLTDFGLSKENFEEDQENTIWGTIKYIAPEAISGFQYNHMVDWWSLGIIIYRMLTGKLPYPTTKNHEVKIFIVKWRIKISRNKFSKAAYDLLTKLLVRNPDKRLGAWGVEEILTHPFFKGINWEKLFNKEITPPYMPKLKSEVDTKLIPKHMIAKGIEASSLDDHDVRQGSMLGQPFENFSYTKDALMEMQRPTEV